MAFQTSLGIDIGHHALSVACARSSMGGPRLGPHAIFPLEGEGTAEEKVGLIGDLLLDFTKKHRVSPTTVFLGIPRDRVVLRYIELPLAVRENLRDTLGYEMEKYVPFSGDEVYFDFQVMGEDKETGKIRLMLVAAAKPSVDTYLGLAKRLSVRLSGMEIGSTAITNYFAHASEKTGDPAGAFLFLCRDRLELGVLDGALLGYSRVLKGREGEFDERELVLRALNILKKLQEGRQDRLTAVLCAPESGPDLVESFRDHGEVLLRVPDLSRDGLPTPAIIPAWGLALKGLVNLPMEINLLPPELRKKPSKIGYYTMLFLAGLVVLSAGAWAGGTIYRHRQTVHLLDAKLKKLGSEVLKIDRDKKECDRLARRIDYLNALRQGDRPVLTIIKELSRRIPESAWVSSFTFSDKGVELEGQAASASELIRLLDASPLFHDVVFLSAITKMRDGKERFRIGLKLAG